MHIETGTEFTQDVGKGIQIEHVTYIFLCGFPIFIAQNITIR